MSRHQSDARPVGYTMNGTAYGAAAVEAMGIDTNGEEVGAVFSWDADDCTCDSCNMPLAECECPLNGRDSRPYYRHKAEQ